MAIYKGSTKIKSVYFGGTKIGKIYKGNQLVYQSESSPKYACYFLLDMGSLGVSYAYIDTSKGISSPVYTVTGFATSESQILSLINTDCTLKSYSDSQISLYWKNGGNTSTHNRVSEGDLYV